MISVLNFYSISNTYSIARAFSYGNRAWAYQPKSILLETIFLCFCWCKLFLGSFLFPDSSLLRSSFWLFFVPLAPLAVVLSLPLAAYLLQTVGVLPSVWWHVLPKLVTNKSHSTDLVLLPGLKLQSLLLIPRQCLRRPLPCNFLLWKGLLLLT